MSDFAFQKDGVERPAENDFQLLPAADYPAMIEKTEWVDAFQAQPGDPKELKLTIRIIDGEFKGRIVWKKLKLNSIDPTELKKAKGQLAQLLDAIDLPGINNTAELCNRPFIAKVGVFAPTPDKTINIVNAFKSMATAPVQAPATATVAKKPWE